MRSKRKIDSRRATTIPASTRKPGASRGKKTATGPAKREQKTPKSVLHEWWLEDHGDESRAALLRNIKERLPALEALRADAKAQWPQNRVHPLHSRYLMVAQVYCGLPPLSLRISNALQELLPNRPMRKHFCDTIAQAAGHENDSSDRPKLAKESESILNAFFIA